MSSTRDSFTRREFLHTTAAAAAASTHVGFAQPESRPVAKTGRNAVEVHRYTVA